VLKNAHALYIVGQGRATSAVRLPAPPLQKPRHAAPAFTLRSFHHVSIALHPDSGYADRGNGQTPRGDRMTGRENLPFILTDHAKERMKTRRVSSQMIGTAIANPDERRYEDDGDTRFIKTVRGRLLHVVAKPLPDQDSWLVKTVWVRGEDDPTVPLPAILMRDIRKRGWGRIWRFVRGLIGLLFRR